MTCLGQKAAQAAAQAVCTRCGRAMLLPGGSVRLTTGLYRLVGHRRTEHFNLCSACGPEFRLFLAGVSV